MSDKKRSSNWTEIEKAVLAEGIAKRFTFLFSNSNSIESIQGWNDILEEINDVSISGRTLVQIKKKYQEIKQEVRQIEAENRRLEQSGNVRNFDLREELGTGIIKQEEPDTLESQNQLNHQVDEIKVQNETLKRIADLLDENNKIQEKKFLILKEVLELKRKKYS